MSRREGPTSQSDGSFGDLDETDGHDRGHYSADEVADACHAEDGQTPEEDDEPNTTEGRP